MRTLSQSLAFFLLLAILGLSAVRAEMVPGADMESVWKAKRIDTLLRQPEKEMDLARVKLTIDKMIEPSIDIDAGVRQIDEMAAQVRAMLRPSASSTQRLQVLQKYIYEKGPWNGFQSFGYDFDDPMGNNIHNKLLPNYIRSRKGNCVTMPVFFVILGQRLGLDVTLSTAPLHLFVKYTDPESGVTYNLETTSGAKPARDVWIRQQSPMTDEAIANGLYMRKLSIRESAAVMATTLSKAGSGLESRVLIFLDSRPDAFVYQDLTPYLRLNESKSPKYSAILARKNPFSDQTSMCLTSYGIIDRFR